MYGGPKSLPDAPIPFIFLQHAFGMKLESDNKATPRIVERLDQAVFGICHGLEMRGQATDTLVVIAIHLESGTPIPFGKRRAGNDAYQMAVLIVLFAVTDMFERRLFLFLDITI